MSQRVIIIGLSSLSLLALLPPVELHACGPDKKCRIGGRHYFIAMPPGHDGASPVGALVFAHGYRGTARAIMRNRPLRTLANDLGIALVAVKSAGDGWSLPGTPSAGTNRQVDEVAYFDDVLKDAMDRFPIDRRYLVASGFSAGGMMVWTLACQRSRSFAAFIPIAGTFWRPIPRSCPTPSANVVHLHGTQDRIVPLGGRRIRDARQGDVRDVVRFYAKRGRFGAPAVKGRGTMRCETRTNPHHRLLSLCTYDGGHILHVPHLRRAWRLLATAGALPSGTGVGKR